MANTTMNISLPEQMRDWIDLQIATGEYSNNSDYVRDLIRQDRKRKEKMLALQAAISKGVESGDAGQLDINEIKAKARERLKK